MGIFAHGTQVTIDSTPIGGLRDIDGPQEEKELVDVTDHDSGGDREYVPGLRDGGTLDLTYLVESTDSGQQALWANYGDNTNPAAAFVITVPADPTISGSDFTISFNGFVISRSPTFPHEDVAAQSVSIKITGPVTHSLVSV